MLSAPGSSHLGTICGFNLRFHQPQLPCSQGDSHPGSVQHLGVAGPNTEQPRSPRPCLQQPASPTICLPSQQSPDLDSACHLPTHPLVTPGTIPALGLGTSKGTPREPQTLNTWSAWLLDRGPQWCPGAPRVVPMNHRHVVWAGWLGTPGWHTSPHQNVQAASQIQVLGPLRSSHPAVHETFPSCPAQRLGAPPPEHMIRVQERQVGASAEFTGEQGQSPQPRKKPQRVRSRERAEQGPKPSRTKPATPEDGCWAQVGQERVGLGSWPGEAAGQGESTPAPATCLWAQSCPGH